MKMYNNILFFSVRTPSFRPLLTVSRFRFFFPFLPSFRWLQICISNKWINENPRVLAATGSIRDAAIRLDAQVVLQVPPPFVYARDWEDMRPRRQSMAKSGIHNAEAAVPHPFRPFGRNGLAAAWCLCVLRPLTTCRISIVCFQSKGRTEYKLY